nr:SDR family NAD(P)-dependent oxidoreductase [Angustibacter aerolatus]
MALVTGGARGIGEATARRLQADGARVAVADLDEQAAQATAAAIGGGAIGIGCDVADAASADAAVERVVGEPGPPRRAGEQRRGDPRQPAVQDERDRLGRRARRAPAGRLPHEPCGAAAPGAAAQRAHREPVERERPRGPRPGELQRGQDGRAGLHPHAGDRASARSASP